MTLFLLLPSIASAYEQMWGPFERGREPRRWPMKPAQLERREDLALTTIHFGSGLVAEFRRAERDEFKVVASLRDSRGKTLIEEFVAFDGAYHTPGDAFISDLNRDGKEDLVTWVPSSGNGLAAYLHARVIFFSTPSGHRADVRMVRAPDVNDFLDTGHRTATIVWTYFIFGEEGRDGRVHNYWVYNLQSIDREKFLEANHRLRGFPKWVMFSFGENHRATRQLTAAQKRRLWKESFENPSRNTPHRPLSKSRM